MSSDWAARDGKASVGPASGSAPDVFCPPHRFQATAFHTIWLYAARVASGNKLVSHDQVMNKDVYLPKIALFKSLLKVEVSQNDTRSEKK